MFQKSRLHLQTFSLTFSLILHHAKFNFFLTCFKNLGYTFGHSSLHFHKFFMTQNLISSVHVSKIQVTPLDILPYIFINSSSHFVIFLVTALDILPYITNGISSSLMRFCNEDCVTKRRVLTFLT